MKANEFDLLGKQFGKLTVISFAYLNEKSKSFWECLCACGNYKIIYRYHLIGGATKSCGCQEGLITHQLSKTREYSIWAGIKQRCLNPKASHYVDYGGRGILLCLRWMRFENFIEDMGFCPTPKHEIERVDNDGNYEPLNCIWATRSVQLRNRRKP